MAREISVIQQEIVNDLVTQGAAVGEVIIPAEWSNFDYRQLLTFVCAVAAGTVEQLFDAFIVDAEGIATAAPPQSPPWLRQQMLLFQFSATDPQVEQFDEQTFEVGYPEVDPALRVIGFCSVVPGAFGSTLIKVAASVDGAPADLDTEYPGALAAAQSYANRTGVPGLSYIVQSGDADRLYVAGTVYYQGAYSAVISDNVTAAIGAYLAGIPFNGTVLISDLERAIKAVEGVNDVVLDTVRARKAATPYGGGVLLVSATSIVSRKYPTEAGYIIPEDDSGHTPADSLTFTAE